MLDVVFVVDALEDGPLHAVERPEERVRRFHLKIRRFRQLLYRAKHRAVDVAQLPDERAERPRVVIDHRADAAAASDGRRRDRAAAETVHEGGNILLGEDHVPQQLAHRPLVWRGLLRGGGVIDGADDIEIAQLRRAHQIDDGAARFAALMLDVGGDAIEDILWKHGCIVQRDAAFGNVAARGRGRGYLRLNESM